MENDNYRNGYIEKEVYGSRFKIEIPRDGAFETQIVK